jgi:hypothetical protein
MDPRPHYSTFECYPLLRRGCCSGLRLASVECSVARRTTKLSDKPFSATASSSSHRMWSKQHLTHTHTHTHTLARSVNSNNSASAHKQHTHSTVPADHYWKTTTPGADAVANWILFLGFFPPEYPSHVFPTSSQKLKQRCSSPYWPTCTYFLHPSRFLEFSVFNQVE